MHWSSVGNPRARDREIVEWARQREHIVFTHDLDFGTILALTRATGPSVIQIRAQDVLPPAIGSILLDVLAAHEDALGRGALITVDEATARLRLLPIRRPDAEDEATGDRGVAGLEEDIDGPPPGD